MSAAGRLRIDTGVRLPHTTGSGAFDSDGGAESGEAAETTGRGRHSRAVDVEVARQRTRARVERERHGAPHSLRLRNRLLTDAETAAEDRSSIAIETCPRRGEPFLGVSSSSTRREAAARPPWSPTSPPISPGSGAGARWPSTWIPRASWARCSASRFAGPAAAPSSCWSTACWGTRADPRHSIRVPCASRFPSAARAFRTSTSSSPTSPSRCSRPGAGRRRTVARPPGAEPERRLAANLERSKELRDYDFVLFDAPPSFGPLTLSVLLACDEVVVPVPLTYLALDGFAELLRTIDLVHDRYGHTSLRDRHGDSHLLPPHAPRARDPREARGALPQGDRPDGGRLPREDRRGPVARASRSSSTRPGTGERGPWPRSPRSSRSEGASRSTKRREPSPPGEETSDDGARDASPLDPGTLAAVLAEAALLEAKDPAERPALGRDPFEPDRRLRSVRARAGRARLRGPVARRRRAAKTSPLPGSGDAEPPTAPERARAWTTLPRLSEIEPVDPSSLVERWLGPGRAAPARRARTTWWRASSPTTASASRPSVLRRAFPFFYALYRLYFRVQSRGHENLPEQGPAILASNHGGLLPFDGAMLIVDLLLHTDPPRLARSVVDRWAGNLPWVSIFYARVGQVIGTRENVADLLADGQLVLVFPEGVAGIRKNVTQRYRLQPLPRGLRRGGPALGRADRSDGGGRKRRPGADPARLPGAGPQARAARVADHPDVSLARAPGPAALPGRAIESSTASRWTSRSASGPRARKIRGSCATSPDRSGTAASSFWIGKRERRFGLHTRSARAARAGPRAAAGDRHPRGPAHRPAHRQAPVPRRRGGVDPRPGRRPAAAILRPLPRLARRSPPLCARRPGPPPSGGGSVPIAHRARRRHRRGDPRAPSRTVRIARPARAGGGRHADRRGAARAAAVPADPLDPRPGGAGQRLRLPAGAGEREPGDRGQRAPARSRDPGRGPLLGRLRHDLPRRAAQREPARGAAAAADGGGDGRSRLLQPDAVRVGGSRRLAHAGSAAPGLRPAVRADLRQGRRPGLAPGPARAPAPACTTSRAPKPCRSRC